MLRSGKVQVPVRYFPRVIEQLVRPGTPFLLPAVPVRVSILFEDGDIAMSAMVLVVDDDEMVRRLAARMLTIQGLRVVEASSGDSALLALQRLAARIDLVVTDLAMPGLDGRNLGGVVGRCWPQIPVLYMSGYPAARMIATGSLEQNWPFIQKPFTGDQLGKKVRELLEGKLAP